MTQAYPLAWPDGWKRTPSYHRKAGAFRMEASRGSPGRRINIEAATKRVHAELERMGVNARDDSVVSTNLRLNMSGIPRGDQSEPGDPGVAVYWQQRGKPMRVMAIDAYARVADNIAAIAATLDAMRAIERHGGAQILDRAFSGFTALPAPNAELTWFQVLGVASDASIDEIKSAHLRLTRTHHPDQGGDPRKMADINAARDKGIAARSLK